MLEENDAHLSNFFFFFFNKLFEFFDTDVTS